MDENNCIDPNPVDPRTLDFGQFRLNCAYSTLEVIIDELIHAGYTVTFRENQDGSFYVHFGFVTNDIY